MGTVRLKNNSRSYIKAGTLVRVDPRDSKSFIPVNINNIDVIGTVISPTQAGRMADILLIGGSSNGTELTKEIIESLLTGIIDTHSHPGGGGTGSSYMPSGW